MPERNSDMVEVVIDSIRVSLMSQQRIVILREVDADRFLPIWIGPYEAEAISIALQQVEVPRPMTHDLLNNVFRQLNARVLRVEVTAMRDEVYYGNIVVEVNGTLLYIDSRPSDALALSVRSHCPIYVARKVMDMVGITPEEDLETQGSEPTPPKIPAMPEPEAEDSTTDRLSVFEDFLENLDFGSDDDEEEDKRKKGK